MRFLSPTFLTSANTHNLIWGKTAQQIVLFARGGTTAPFDEPPLVKRKGESPFQTPSIGIYQLETSSILLIL